MFPLTRLLFATLVELVLHLEPEFQHIVTELHQPNTNGIWKQVIVDKHIIPTPNHRALHVCSGYLHQNGDACPFEVDCSTVESFRQPQCKIKMSYNHRYWGFNTKSLDIIPWSSRLIVLYWAAISSLAAGVSGTKYGTSTYRMRTETFKLRY